MCGGCQRTCEFELAKDERADTRGAGADAESARFVASALAGWGDDLATTVEAVNGHTARSGQRAGSGEVFPGYMEGLLAVSALNKIERVQETFPVVEGTQQVAVLAVGSIWIPYSSSGLWSTMIQARKPFRSSMVDIFEGVEWMKRLEDVGDEEREQE